MLSALDVQSLGPGLMLQMKICLSILYCVAKPINTRRNFGGHKHDEDIYTPKSNLPLNTPLVIYPSATLPHRYVQ